MSRHSDGQLSDTRSVAIVDPDDDSIQRYIVRRYAYDPERHERRHQVVAAFDNAAEFQWTFDDLTGELERRRAGGQLADPQEYVSGVILEPGHRRRQRDGRLLKAAMRHGALSDDLLERLELPSNVGVGRHRPGSDHTDYFGGC